MNGIRFEGRGHAHAGFGHLSARSAGLPCDAAQPTRPVRRPAIAAAVRRPGLPWGIMGVAMSTRYLIVAALVTGLVILAASAVQLLMAR